MKKKFKSLCPSDATPCSASSDTPETDAQSAKCCLSMIGEFVPADFARKLERERDQQQRWKDEWIECGHKQASRIATLEAELLTVIEVARRNMPRKHGTIERIAESLLSARAMTPGATETP